ncbi:MAG: ABC transporter permease subunit [Alphaproteobacteria bacterium]
MKRSPLLRDAGLSGRRLVAAVPLLWLGVFFLLPFAIVLKISLTRSVLGQPPYTPVVEWIGDGFLRIRLFLGNYAFLAEDPLYVAAYLNSLKVAAIATGLCLLLGYPMAYAIARAAPALRTPLLMLVVLPFWTSFVIRVYAWIGILKNNGLINNFLLWLGLIDEPLPMLHTDFAIYVGLVYSYLPFMVLPLYATLARLDVSLLEAAADLGCRPSQVFRRVTLPLSMPGVAAGALLVFIPAVGEFVIPDLLGGPDSLMIGAVLWSEFFANHDWPLSSAVAVAMLALLVVPFVLLRRRSERF